MNAATRVSTALLLGALLAAPAASLPAASAQPPPAAPRLSDEAAVLAEVAAVMADRAIPGAQLVLVLPGGETWERVFGVRDLASGLPMTRDTLIQVGSVTKVVTATLVADLVARGRLRWSDRLGALLPGVAMRREYTAITLDELVTHTARLPANPPNRVDVDGVMQPYGEKQLYESLSDRSVRLGEPGRTYSNWGYALLGHVAERAAGKRFEALLAERVFAPLGMSHSSITLSAADARRLAVHYWPEDTPRVPRPRWVFGEIAGFGGITSTAGDLARFLAFQMHPERRPGVLGAAAIESMREVRVLLPSWSAGGARGWLVVRDRAGTITLEHSGEVDGHSSYIGYSPAADVGVAATANLGGSSARDIALPVLARAIAEARSRQPVDRDRALSLARKRQWADAEAALAKVAAAAPTDGEAWHLLGVARYELRDLPGAEAALRRAEAAPDGRAAALFQRALLAASQGRVRAAFQRLDEAARAGLRAADADLGRPELRALRSDRRWPLLVRRLSAAPDRSGPR